MVDDAHPTRMLRPGDPGYPQTLWRLGGRVLPGRPRWVRPPTLHIRGVLPPQRLLAVVGTRTPCSPAVAWTHELVRRLGPRGWAIGSGGAEGIDDAAHRAAVAAGIPTVVVTVGGLDAGRHTSTAALFAEVLASGGALVSLDPDGTRPIRPDFFRRNHLLAALADGLVAVELRPRHGQGGTGHTLRTARALGRPVMTVSHPPWTAGGRATVALVREGIPLVATAEDVEWELARFHASPAPPPRAGSTPSESLGAPSPDRSEPCDRLSGDAQRTLDALELEPTHVDVLCTRLGVDIARLQRSLLECTLAGALREEPPGHFARVERVASRRAAGETSGVDGPLRRSTDEDDEP